MTTAVKIVKPITINSSILTSTNVSDNPPADWNAGTAYAVDAEAVVPSLHAVYVRLVAGTTATSPELDPVNWVYKSPSNDYAMFDGSNSTQTSNATSIDVTVEPGTITNTMALLNCDAQTIDVVMTETITGDLLDETYDMQSPPTQSNWYAYFFDEITYKKDLIIDLPSSSTAEINVVINHPTTAKCGTMLLGKAFYVGDGIQFGASVGIQDYSRKELDQFGNYNLIERNFAKRANWSIWIGANEVDNLQNLLADIRATPTLFVGSNEYTSTAIYGFYKDFDIVIQYAENSLCNMQIEGLT